MESLNRTIESNRQMDEIFYGFIREEQFQTIEFDFVGIYPDFRPLRKPVILSCHRLCVKIHENEIVSIEELFEDVSEWLHAGVVVGRTKQLCLVYWSSKCDSLFAFLGGLKQVISYLPNLILKNL